MPGLGTVVLGALAVFVIVVASLLIQGMRRRRSRLAQRNDLGLVRISQPDPALTARILSAFPAATDGSPYGLAGLERVTIARPGTWYVALVKRSSAVTTATDEPAQVLLAVDGLQLVGVSSEPATIEGTGGVWTRRCVSGVLIVEGASGAGEATRDFEGMKAAGARAVDASLAP